MAPDPAVASTDWRTLVYDGLRARGTTIFAYVPDSAHTYAIDRAIADPAVTAVALTCEEEGVGVAVGASLGSAKSVLLMQSSGAGNCINFLSLVQHCRIPFLTVVSMRGEFGEQNPWQFAMGQAVERCLTAMGLDVLRADRVDDVTPVLAAASGMVDRGGRSVAVLLGQRLIGAKAF